VWLRLCWAAWRAGFAARRTDELLELPPDVPVGSRTPHRPYGHPDLVLGRAVAAGITDTQAELISSTRLGDVLIEADRRRMRPVRIGRADAAQASRAQTRRGTAAGRSERSCIGRNIRRGQSCASAPERRCQPATEGGEGSGATRRLTCGDAFVVPSSANMLRLI
jgi:hypothetical protein